VDFVADGGFRFLDAPLPGNALVNMADICEADYGTAYYRSRDPIKNFRIRYRDWDF